jgi:membrane protein DedA with SNARE-associated domain
VLHFPTESLVHLLEAYGYWAIAVTVAVESSGIPFPGETVLVLAATYAGKTHNLSLPWIIAAAAGGAIAGDNLGFLAGRTGGFALLRRYGRVVRLDDRRLKLGLWLFRRYGFAVVFFGRFVAVLRAWAAILAGTNRMPWPHFLVANAAGGAIWATVVGIVAYNFGAEASRVTGPVGWALLAVAIVAVAVAVSFIKKHERQLEDAAERALPGPIDEIE